MLSSPRARRRGAIFVASVAIGLVCALWHASRAETDLAVATTHVLVETPQPTLLDPEAVPQDFEVLGRRAEMLGRVIVSPPVLAGTARLAGVPRDELSGLARDTEPVLQALKEPASEQRANEILGAERSYRLEAQGRPSEPVLDIYAQASTTQLAVRLADSAVESLRLYLARLAGRQGLSPDSIVKMKQLGAARGGMVAGKGARIQVAALTFLVAFPFTLALLVGLTRLRAYADRRRPPGSGRRDRVAALRGGDWPRTGRLLPWMVAVFMAIVWLTPFSAIELNASLPIDLEFDRLVLPLVVAVWAFALAVGGPLAPQLQVTWVHAGIATFVFVAFLSVVVHAEYLGATLELDHAVKKLPLLVTYVSLFVIAASVIRRSEINAFLVYTLALAVIVSVGMVWEYRFSYNVFYDLTEKILPGFFTVETRVAGAVDGIGRLEVAGPAAVPLEAVAMLSMALPVAVVGAMNAVRRRSRMLYGLAACVVMAAIIATFRKSGLIAPALVGLTIAYYRREHILKLVPLLVAGGIVVHMLSPGALGSTVGQFSPDQLGVGTVSDRAADYDALRPDMWTNLALGRGFGTYEYTRYRVLDNDLLHRLAETGVIGLAAYLFMILSVIACASRVVRDRRWGSEPALIGAAGAVGFLVTTVLFDVLSFPHAMYIFLFTAAIVARVVATPKAEPEPHAESEQRPAQATLSESLLRAPAHAGGGVLNR